MKPETYAELVRKAMRAKGMTRRDLEKAIDYSYEHIRKVVSGLPLMSEDFNDKVCRVLELDAPAMWAIAQGEKLKRTYGSIPTVALPTNRLKELWSELSADDQAAIMTIAEGMAARRRAERDDRNLEDPDRIRQRIMQLMDRLGGTRATSDLPQRQRA